MSTEDNKAIVRRYIEELDKGNVAVIDELMSPNYVDHNAGPGEQPDREGLKQYYTEFFPAFSDVHTTINQLIAEEDKVVVHLTSSGKHTGEFLGKAATGKQLTMTVIRIFRIADGKIAENWDDIGLQKEYFEEFSPSESAQ